MAGQLKTALHMILQVKPSVIVRRETVLQLTDVRLLHIQLSV